MRWDVIVVEEKRIEEEDLVRECVEVEVIRLVEEVWINVEREVIEVE